MSTPTPPAPSAGLSAERLAEIRKDYRNGFRSVAGESYGEVLHAIIGELLPEVIRLRAQKPGDGNTTLEGGDAKMPQFDPNNPNGPFGPGTGTTGPGDGNASPTGAKSPIEQGVWPLPADFASPAAPALTDEDAITTYLACIAQHGDPGMDMGNWSDFVNRTLRSVRRISTLEASLAKAEADRDAHKKALNRVLTMIPRDINERTGLRGIFYDEQPDSPCGFVPADLDEVIESIVAHVESYFAALTPAPNKGRRDLRSMWSAR